MKRFKISFHGDPVVNHDVARSLLGEKYTTKETTYSVRAESDAGSVLWSQEPMGHGLLSWIGRFRAHVTARLKEIHHVRRRPRYVASARCLRSGEPVRGSEIDLSAAYLTSAREIGAVSQAFYRACLSKLSKKSRLKVVGSLGTHVVERTWDGARQTGIRHYYKNPELRKVWDSIVAHTDRTMENLKTAAGRDFLYYWCDAIFVSPAAARRTKAAALRAGFSTSRPKVYTLRSDRFQVYVSGGRAFPLRPAVGRGK